MTFNYNKTYFDRIFGESFSIVNIFTTDGNAQLDDILKTDILNDRFTAIYSLEDVEKFIPREEQAINYLTGPIYTDKISTSDFKKLNYDDLLVEIETYIANDPEDYVLISFRKLFYATLDKLRDDGIEGASFYYLNADNFPESSLFEVNVYDYYITIIVQLETGSLLRLTFGND
ncbi:hypothetical protein AAEO56_08800 [Flavobacterium sp. DGU11]|uniref:DUF2004 domain-containing protein n=1 Tax=Flavobacterium arundinis TaxID=3139143 RepID=A0ABU9HW11_9FLAO